MLHVESDIFTLKHLAIYGILNANSAAWTYAVSLFRRNQFHLAPLISHRFAVEEYQDAIDTVRIGQALKVVMTHTESPGCEERGACIPHSVPHMPRNWFVVAQKKW